MKTIEKEKFYYIIDNLSIGLSRMGEGFDEYNEDKFEQSFKYCIRQLDYLIALKKKNEI